MVEIWMFFVSLLGWISSGDEKPLPPLPPLTKPTRWKRGAVKIPISRYCVSPSSMWDIVTEDRKHILFFENSESSRSTLHWDVGEENDVPRVSFKTRIVPPRNVEYEMTIHTKSRKQLAERKIPEEEMYSYCIRERLEIV